VSKRDDPQRFLPLTPLSTSILLALSDGERHGYGIIKEIERQSGGRQAPAAGSLYAALQRMVEQDLLKETTGPAQADDPRRRYYALTRLGREVARAEMLRMADLVVLAAEKKLVPELRPAFQRLER
jgi:DNA-binding PadR family transcriptional regulator